MLAFLWLSSGEALGISPLEQVRLNRLREIYANRQEKARKGIYWQTHLEKPIVLDDKRFGMFQLVYYILSGQPGYPEKIRISGYKGLVVVSALYEQNFDNGVRHFENLQTYPSTRRHQQHVIGAPVIYAFYARSGDEAFLAKLSETLKRLQVGEPYIQTIVALIKDACLNLPEGWLPSIVPQSDDDADFLGIYKRLYPGEFQKPAELRGESQSIPEDITPIPLTNGTLAQQVPAVEPHRRPYASAENSTDAAQESDDDDFEEISGEDCEPPQNSGGQKTVLEQLPRVLSGLFYRAANFAAGRLGFVK